MIKLMNYTADDTSLFSVMHNIYSTAAKLNELG